MTKVTSVRTREDYTRLIVVALVLSVGILIAFQIYIVREPSRIQNVLAADQAAQVTRGAKLYSDNCTTCHGDNGEGDKGPALNSKSFLKSADDSTIFSLISSGVPGTAMPTWAQAHGGPFTDEQVRDLVSFIRHWEPTAPDTANVQPTPDIAQGQLIFSSICYACHGDNGQGTKNAPALNSQDLLSQFDDNWFRQTVANGRPAKGMPTWGAVLSPAQINNVVAYIRAWQTAPSTTIVTPTGAAQVTAQPTPTVVALAPTPTTAAVVLAPTTAPATQAAASPTTAATTAATATTAAPTAGASGQGVVPNCGKANCSTPGAAITQNLKGDPSHGPALFVSTCQKCHGTQGKGGKSNPGSTDGTIPALNPIDPLVKGNDAAQFALTVDLFVEHGSTPDGPSPANVMTAFGDEKKLTPQQIADLIAYVMSLNP